MKRLGRYVITGDALINYSKHASFVMAQLNNEEDSHKIVSYDPEKDYYIIEVESDKFELREDSPFYRVSVDKNIVSVKIS